MKFLTALANIVAFLVILAILIVVGSVLAVVGWLAVPAFIGFVIVAAIAAGIHEAIKNRTGS